MIKKLFGPKNKKISWMEWHSFMYKMKKTINIIASTLWSAIKKSVETGAVEICRDQTCLKKGYK